MARTLPSFLIVGAQKCGTTSLAAYLSAHPQIFMCRPKEPNFFSYRWAEGIEAYRQLFHGSEEYRAIGEASVSYSMAPDVPDVPRRIASVIPDVRIVYLIRHPTERIRSHYRFRVSRGKETAPTLAEALARHPRYVNFTRYAYQLEQYLDFFDASRIRVVSSERLRAHRRETMEEVLAFLDVDAGIVPPNLEVELHRGQEMGRVATWVETPRWAWRRMPWLTGRIPRSWRKGMRSRLSGAFPTHALEIPSEVEKALLNELRPDLERLRAIVGPDQDLWGLA